MVGLIAHRDFAFVNAFQGIFFYDTGQRFIYRDVTIRECDRAWPHCLSDARDGKCEETGAMEFLVFSDQFVPALSQATSGLDLENVDPLFLFTNDMSKGVTVSSRLQHIMDADGSLSQGRWTGRALAGSRTAGNWWRVDPRCPLPRDRRLRARKARSRWFRPSPRISRARPTGARSPPSRSTFARATATR